MPTFKYTANDPLGQSITGWVHADDLQNARQLLISTGRDLRDIVLVEASEEFSSEEKFVDAEPTASEAEPVQIGTLEDAASEEKAAEEKSSEAPSDRNQEPRFSSVRAMPILEEADRLVQQGVPLGEGLRALADELPGGRNAAAIWALADRIDMGESLHDAMASLHFKIPRHIQQLLKSGASTGRFGVLLHQLVHLEQERRGIFREALAAIAYPAFLLAFLALFSVLFGMFVVVEFEKIFCDFGSQLPPVTEAVLEFFNIWQWVILGGLGIVILLYILIDYLSVPPAMKRLLNWVPLIGPLRRWNRLARYSQMMALMTDEQVPLTSAIRTAADGAGRNDVATTCLSIADAVESGVSFSNAAEHYNLYPPSCASIIRWGDENSALSEAFEIVSDIAKTRMRSMIDLLNMVACPVALIIFLCYVPTIVIALLYPLIQLITDLT